jgi:hypothetical protein
MYFNVNSAIIEASTHFRQIKEIHLPNLRLSCEILNKISNNSWINLEVLDLSTLVLIKEITV